MARIAPEEGFELLKDRVQKAVSGFFPIIGRKNTLELHDISVKDNLNIDDIRSQKHAKLSGRSWTVPVEATIALKDNTTGSIIDKQKMNLLNLPKVTRRYGHIVDGQEYQIDNQWRLKPGIYNMVKQDGAIESHFNAAGGFKIHFDPKSRQFTLNYGNSNMPLRPFLHAMGVSEEEVENRWGKDIATVNHADSSKELIKFYRASTGDKTVKPTIDEAKSHLWDVMQKTVLRPEVTKFTLGKEYTNVTGHTLLDASDKLLKISRGEAQPDPRDALMFKDLHSIEDFAAERLIKGSREILRKVNNNIDRKDKVRDIIAPEIFNRPIKQMFGKNSLAIVTDQTNPLEMFSANMKTTIMGDGGIKSEHTVSDEAKLIDPSHLGFLDPIHTPEGCYDSETEVYTKTGWKKWITVTEQDQLACRVDGRLEFHLPTNLINAPYKGKMYGVNTARNKQRRKREIDYLVTPNHRIYCRTRDLRGKALFRIETADVVHGKARDLELGHDPYLGSKETGVFHLPYVKGNNSSKNVDEINIGDWAQFIGWFLSEGNCTYDDVGSHYSVCISQSIVTSRTNCEIIEALLDRLPFAWSFSEREDGKRTYRVSTKQLAHYVSQFGLSYNKSIPEYFFECSVETREYLLEALLLGDGRKNSHRATGASYKQLVYCTVSPQLALDVERLAISLGRPVSMCRYADDREERYRDVYEVRLLCQTKREIQGAKGHFYTSEYDGTIHCATVPGGLLYVRRGTGLAHWSGNSATGITLRLPLGVHKIGHDVAIKMYNTKTGKVENVNPTVAYKSHIALPDQITWEGNKPKAAGKVVKISGPGNEIYDGTLKDADYVMKSPMQMFSISSNMIPFMPSDHPNRSTMAGRQMEQAISLKHREIPLVQSLAGKESFDRILGSFASHSATVSGTVSKIKPDAIVIKRPNGTKEEVFIYDHFPLNENKAFMHAEPLVKVGDKVTKGQVIADTNYTKDGVLAIGTNLRTGFMPYKGYNFDDGIVVSESAAQKLTSEHLHRHSLERDVSHILDKKKFTAYMPTVLNKTQYDKLDEEGVIKPGTVVMPGDTLIAALRASNNPERKEDLELSKLHKSIVKPYKDSSIKWESDYPGVVKEVVKIGKNVSVHVKTEEALDIGDKLCYDEKHELLTTRGWVPVKDVKVSDEVCSLNPETDAIEYLCPEKTVSYDCVEDDLYVLETTQVSMAVTMEHKTYAKPRGADRHSLIPVSQLVGKRYHLKQHGKWVGEDRETFEFPSMVVKAGQSGNGTRVLPSIQMPMDTFLMLLGMYLSEGNNYGGNGDYYIEITQIKQPGRAQTEEALALAGIRFTRTPEKIRIHGKQLYEYFVQFGHAVNKFIPDWIFQLPKKRLQVLYKWLMWGDGCEKGTTHVYTTISPQLADDVQRLVFHLGKAGRVVWEPGYRGQIEGRYYDFKPRYRVRVIRTKLEPTINHGHSNSQGGQKETIEKYTGKVYCVALPRNHVLYTRRNGKCHWSGNTARHGNKGIVTRIIPDHDMPHTKDGKHLEVLLNPLSVMGRTNLGQVLEVAAAKVAEKTGKPYMVKNFSPNTDLHAQVTADLAKHGLTDKEEVIDPVTNRVMGNVLVGPMHIFKLHHQVEKKLSARAGGYGYDYDKDMIPKGGGPRGAKSLGTLGLYSMLAHGATSNLREMQTYKSDASQGDQFWSALQAGEMLPTPKPTFAYNKFLGYIRGLGVNVQKTGNNLTLMPMTDKQIIEQSNGEITDPAKSVTAKNMKPEIGGLFDPKVTGGIDGTKWGFYTLPESMPNPVFESAITRLLGMKQKEFAGLIGGTLAVDPKTGKIGDSQKIEGGLVGGKAFAHMLSKIDVKKDLAAAKVALDKPTLRGTYLDHANSKVKLLEALNKVGMTPVEAYMSKVIPILPPSMRPVPVLPNGTISEEDLNGLYKNLHLSASRYAKMSPLIPEDDQSKVEIRQEVYDGLRAIAGLGGYPHQIRRGILDYIHGKKMDTRTDAKIGSPKEGFFQDKLVERKQDMSMRGTIIPEPSLGLDEVGLPREAAIEVYKPFVIRELRNLLGIPPLQAQKKLAEGGEIVDRALQKVISTRPILLKRDPVLHKYGVQAFKPRIVGGKAVQVHPLVTSGFNADFDGDAMGAFVPVSMDAVAEAYKMLPSRNLFSPSSGEIMYAPTNESRLGLYGITQTGKDTNHKFTNMQDLETAIRTGAVTFTDQVTVGGIKSSAGKFMVAGALPETMRREILERKTPLDKKAQEELFTQVAREHKNDYGEVANKLKDLGNKWATDTAFSFGMTDIAPERQVRDRILAAADAQVHKLTGANKDSKKIDIYSKATEEMNKHLKATPESQNNIMILHNVGMKGGTDTLRQIRATPMLMSNHKGEILPNPIRKSYAEGLDVADYWTAISGGRKGIIQKVQSVAEPGYISKQVMNSVMNNLILDHDCGTDKGISLPVDEKDILGRFTAADINVGGHVIKSGALITPEMRSTLRNNNIGKVVVRSPLRCLHGPGLCQKCNGLTENGELPAKGLNVGVLAGQALGERSVQLAMKAFHSGGSAASRSGLVDDFERVKNLLSFPKILPGSATLSELNGKVTKIAPSPAGGHEVSIEDKVHYIPHALGAPVYNGQPLKVGTEVKKGSPISNGLINPHEMLTLTGVEPVQLHLASELSNAYADSGIRRRNHEIVVKALTNLTKVKDPGSSSGLIRGDFASTTYVSNINRNMPKGSRPIVHEPILKGVNVLPLEMQEDWIAKLNHENLSETIIDAAQRGWTSSLHGLHPIPAVIYGAEIGLPGKGKVGY